MTMDTAVVLSELTHLVEIEGVAATLVVREAVIDVVSVAEQGPPGGSFASYTHTQASALAVWTVPHNLNRKPGVTVVDNLDQRIEPDVAYVDMNTVRVSHGTALTGKVYCN